MGEIFTSCRMHLVHEQLERTRCTSACVVHELFVNGARTQKSLLLRQMWAEIWACIGSCTAHAPFMNRETKYEHTVHEICTHRSSTTMQRVHTNIVPIFSTFLFRAQNRPLTAQRGEHTTHCFSPNSVDCERRV